jgi:hypothetical protein
MKSRNIKPGNRNRRKRETLGGLTPKRVATKINSAITTQAFKSNLVTASMQSYLSKSVLSALRAEIAESKLPHEERTARLTIVANYETVVPR